MITLPSRVRSSRDGTPSNMSGAYAVSSWSHGKCCKAWIRSLIVTGEWSKFRCWIRDEALVAFAGVSFPVSLALEFNRHPEDEVSDFTVYVVPRGVRTPALS